MLLNVADLEMNQPSGAIIQLGACTVDLKSGAILSTFNRYVNPNEALDPRIIELTGISQAEVDAGVSLHQALASFWLWGSSKHFAAWGSDMHQIIAASEADPIGIIVPERLHLYDIKDTASILRCAFPSSRARGGLQDTLKLFGLTFIGRPHDAVCDSVNTAHLAAHFTKCMRTLNVIRASVAETLE